MNTHSIRTRSLVAGQLDVIVGSAHDQIVNRGDDDFQLLAAAMWTLIDRYLAVLASNEPIPDTSILLSEFDSDFATIAKLRPGSLGGRLCWFLLNECCDATRALLGGVLPLDMGALADFGQTVRRELRKVTPPTDVCITSLRTEDGRYMEQKQENEHSLEAETIAASGGETFAELSPPQARDEIVRQLTLLAKRKPISTRQAKFADAKEAIVTLDDLRGTADAYRILVGTPTFAPASRKRSADTDTLVSLSLDPTAELDDIRDSILHELNSALVRLEGLETTGSMAAIEKRTISKLLNWIRRLAGCAFTSQGDRLELVPYSSRRPKEGRWCLRDAEKRERLLRGFPVISAVRKEK